MRASVSVKVKVSVRVSVGDKARARATRVGARPRLAKAHGLLDRDGRLDLE